MPDRSCKPRVSCIALESSARCPVSVSQIAADFDALAAVDFDYSNVEANGWAELDRLCEEMIELNDASTGAPVMFLTMERLDNVELGTPGPLVHTLESWPGEYETLLAESVRRKPSPLAVWMVNRILNTQPADSDVWLALLASVMENSSASESTKSDAADFLQRQTGTKTV
jgi:hypothetical protein